MINNIEFKSKIINSESDEIKAIQVTADNVKEFYSDDFTGILRNVTDRKYGNKKAVVEFEIDNIKSDKYGDTFEIFEGEWFIMSGNYYFTVSEEEFKERFEVVS